MLFFGQCIPHGLQRFVQCSLLVLVQGDALVGQAGEQINGIYEADYREFNRDTYLRGREAFDRTYAEFKELLIGAWWRDMQMAKEEAEHGEAQEA